MFSFDSNLLPFNSRRRPIFCNRGMVATAHPLAAQVGLNMIKKGGNAIDAAVATAAALTVLTPNSTGIGGDNFALVWHRGTLHGLNSSGVSPQNLEIDTFRAAGEIPKYGGRSVTVPGAPIGWASLIERFGRLPLSIVLEDAVDLAENGFPVATTTSLSWERMFRLYRKELKEDHFKSLFDTFSPGGKTPSAGEIWRCKDQANTLREIGKNPRDFYHGELASKIVSAVQQAGGSLSLRDMEKYQPEWVTPISTSYAGHEIWQVPPNTQGSVTLIALKILERLDLKKHSINELIHYEIEAIKYAFSLASKILADSRIDDQDYLLRLSTVIDSISINEMRGEASNPDMVPSSQGGTVYIATADGDGNMVSLMQSNYFGFGSCVVPEKTGISLHCRAAGFSLDPKSPNFIGPNKRPLHTLCPSFITKNGSPIGAFGITGAAMQPQGQLQLLVQLIDQGMNPQAALDAPRWLWTGNNKIEIERSFNNDVVEALRARGHQLSLSENEVVFGHGQIIMRDECNVFCGGTEPRREGTIAAW